MSTLKQHAQKWVKQKMADGYTKRQAIDEMEEHGCVSGIVSELIYYTDTVAFFKEHQEEINEILKENIESTGLGIHELFRDFDQSDPLCLENHNKNLLAWFGFEEAVSRLR